MKHINESGRSMVEMLGVLAIIGVLSVGGIAGYSKAMNKYKINKTTDQVSMLVANIRTLFSSQGNYAGLNNGQAVKFGVVPNDMYSPAANIADDMALTNAFAGDVTIKTSASDAEHATNAFSITYEGLSSEACVTVATGDWGSGQASGLIALAAGSAVTDATLDNVYIGGNGSKAAAGAYVAQPGGGADGLATPMTVTDAVTTCSGAGNGNVISWKYY